MTNIKLIKPEKISLKEHKVLREQWVQQVIAEDPRILGLGNLELKYKEKIQPRAGRLDLLLQDVDNERYYEVEVQLGKLDESHIIRTIEYWDIERKRRPQYDHCAVIVAEDMTSRFLNVVSLFNRSIPLIAIQMSAFQYSLDQVSLVFTTVLDELSWAIEEEEEEAKVVTDRNYWESIRGTKQTVEIVDELLKLIRTFVPEVELKYTKDYIGLSENGQSHNFVIFRPRKNSSTVEIRMEYSPDIQEKLDNAKLDIIEYSKRIKRYRIRIDKKDIAQHQKLLIDLMKQAYGLEE